MVADGRLILRIVMLFACFAVFADEAERIFPSTGAEPKARAGTRCERQGAVVVVHNEGTYGWPGIELYAGHGKKTWDLSGAGAVKVVVSNMSETVEQVHALVMTRDMRIEQAPSKSSLVPPHAVRVIAIPLADDSWATDKPVKLEGMLGKVGDAAVTPRDFSQTVHVDVFQCQRGRLHKSKFAVLSVVPAFSARKPKVISSADFFPFVDRYGQFRHDEWPGKIHSDEEMEKVRMKEEKWLAENAAGPCSGLDRYGGWAEGPRLKATGSFRTEKVNGKWWLVDPEGHLFFSLGITCLYIGNPTIIEGRRDYFEWLPVPGAADCDGLGIDHENGKQVFNFFEANAVRKYGKQWKPHFADIAHRRLRAWGINTIANWSQEFVWRLDRTPYTATLNYSSRTKLPRKGGSGRDVPDVYSEKFERDVRDGLESLAEKIRDDPWCVGVYVDNELAWDSIENAGEVAERYFSTIGSVMKELLPNRLYLGARFARGGEAVWRAAARHCDVVSYNFYERQPARDLPVGSVDKPIIVGEFHFGAKDRGLFIGGCVTTFDQKERAECFKDYVNTCLDHWRYVGCHWFQYYDQPLAGRPDGENYQCGFLSVCDFPHPELVKACRETASQMYQRRYK